LLFKVDLIVKNLKGEIVLDKKLDKLSEVFDEENQSIIGKVCDDLQKKAQYIVEERRNEAKMIQENKAFLDSN
jgi:vacuolar-type H+-ATPase subunit E/Vma4